jgi:predicted small metal-binding protein
MDGTMQVRCACGWETTGSEAQVIEATIEHGRRLHNMVPTREEVLAMVVDATSDETVGDPAAGESA